ncbi:MAG: glycerol-3-phosphate 1-O-acyltransferase PlsY [Pseudomonadota bacterium]
MPVFDTPYLVLLIVALLAYLLGSVPFGLVVARIMGLPDPRTIGSKNIGATNVLRTGSKPAALATVLLDGAKGFVAVLLARAIAGEDAAQIAALAAFIGHCLSLFLKFKGGKGVATFLGALFGLAFILGVAACLIWLLVCVVTRYSSLSAIVAAGGMPMVAVFMGFSDMFVIVAMMAAFLIWRHRENIGRLRAGTESKVGLSGT